MIRSMLFLALLFSQPLSAQDQNTDIGESATITWTLQKPSLFVGGQIAVIGADGEVKIDWPAAELTVADPNSVGPMTLAIARLMLAVRDGTWKPLSK